MLHNTYGTKPTDLKGKGRAQNKLQPCRPGQRPATTPGDARRANVVFERGSVRGSRAQENIPAGERGGAQLHLFHPTVYPATQEKYVFKSTRELPPKQNPNATAFCSFGSEITASDGILLLIKFT